VKKIWIKLTKRVDTHEPGTFLEVEDSLGRAYITAGMAEDGGTGPDQAINAQFRAALESLRAESTALVNGVANQLREVTANLPRPKVGAGVEFRHLGPGEQQADRTRSDHDMIRQIVLAADHQNPEDARAANERLTRVYGCQRVQTEGTGSAGGYLTSTVFESSVFEVAAEEGLIAPYATEVPLAAADVEWPALDQYQTPAKGQSAFFAGVAIYRRGETVQRTGSQAAWRKVKMQANDLTAYTEISRNLVMDANVAVPGYTTRLIGQAVGWREDWECFWGSGAGQLLGFLSSGNNALLTVNRANANQLGYTDLAKMKARLLPMSRKRARWYLHPFIEEQLLELQDPAGRYIFIPNWPASNEGPAQQAPGARLLGLPVEFSEKCAPLGTQGDVSLVDPRCYLMGRRSGLEIGLSEHFKFDTDEIAIRAKLRNDGKPWLLDKITLADGTGANKVSGFISLI
jgi:HK97 family phage major capsid protein